MTVKDTYRQYNVIILHSTRHLGGAGGNKCIDINSTVAQRIIKAFTTETAISCCSFKSGETLKNIFGPAGLFLCDGEIIAANEFDLGSHINDDCERVCDPQSLTIKEQVDNAINQKEHWNEFLIRNHKEFGIFLCIDDIHYLYQQVGQFEQFYLDTCSLGIPYFLIHQGQIFESVFDHHQKMFCKQSSIQTSDLIKKYCG
jgi:hypothetical protein